ncbi:MAG: RNA polymerase sigma factor [bacterium]|nr:RNA polymerase sigma factor [bacterium]
MTVPSEADEFRSQIEAGNLKGAAEYLLERHGADSLAVCRAMVGDADAARDLFHDSFMRACDGLTGYRGEATPKTWFLRITHNRCIDHLRREKRRPWVLAADMGWKAEADDGGQDWIEEGHSPEERSVVDGLMLDAIGLARAIETLEERDRSLVILRYAHEMSFAELGEAFGVKPGAMRMRVQRALARLREVMEGSVEEFSATFEDSAPSMSPRPSAEKLSYDKTDEYFSESPPDRLGQFVDQMRRFHVPLEKAAIRKLLESVDSFRRSLY